MNDKCYYFLSIIDDVKCSIYASVGNIKYYNFIWILTDMKISMCVSLLSLSQKTKQNKELTALLSCKMVLRDQTWWYMPVIPTTREV
jgi:hypothetical protein